MKEKTERARYWEKVIQEQSDGGIPVKRFCEERQLAPCSFYWWRRELRGLNKRRLKTKGASGPGFVQVVASGPSAVRQASGVTLRLDDRVDILLDSGFDREVLAAVLSTLREPSQCSR